MTKTRKQIVVLGLAMELTHSIALQFSFKRKYEISNKPIQDLRVM